MAPGGLVPAMGLHCRHEGGSARRRGVYPDTAPSASHRALSGPRATRSRKPVRLPPTALAAVGATGYDRATLSTSIRPGTRFTLHAPFAHLSVKLIRREKPSQVHCPCSSSDRLAALGPLSTNRGGPGTSLLADLFAVIDPERWQQLGGILSHCSARSVPAASTNLPAMTNSSRA